MKRLIDFSTVRVTQTVMAAVALAGLAGCAESTPEQKKTSPVATASAPAAPAPPPPVVTPDADFRAHKPPASDHSAQFDAPVPTVRTLTNGAKLLVVENHAVPLVAIHVLIQTGADGDPAGKAGLARFCANMLAEGTKSRSAEKFAEAVEDLALVLAPQGGQETTAIRVNSLKETLAEGLDLLADALVHPAFRSEDVERVRGLLLTELEQKQATPQLVARDEMTRLLYGDKHPWGQPVGGTPASVKAISVADLIAFHDKYFRPSNAIISVSGDVTEAELVKLLEQKLAGWKKRPRVAVKLPPIARARRTVVFVDKAGASQTQVLLFGPAVAAKSPDATPLRVASYILGGPFARLDLNLREGKGYTYGARANLTTLRDQGYWLANAPVKAAVTAESLSEFQKELTQFSDGTIKPAELDTAKEAVVRLLPTSLERNDSVAAAMAQLEFNGQPLDYYRTFAAAVAKVDAAEIARVAKKYDRLADWSIVMVGPRAASEEKLKALSLGQVVWKGAAAGGKSDKPTGAPTK